MSERLSDNTYCRGRAAFDQGRYLEALALFEASMELDRRQHRSPSMTCVSYYGVCVAMAGTRMEDAQAICLAAASAEPENAILHLNLGKVYLRRGNRSEAFEALVRGLQLAPREPEIIDAARGMGFRRRPPIGFLSRRHPLNRMLGQIRAGQDRNSLSSALERL